MSKTLYLLRHAKAGPRAAGQRDHDRELTDRGRREAAALGSRSAADGELPELVIASTAARAVQTAALWAKAAGLPEQRIIRRDGIYLADAEAVLRLVHGLDEALQRVLLVGHNPTFSELATGLSGRFIALPTGAMAVNHRSPVGRGKYDGALGQLWARGAEHRMVFPLPFFTTQIADRRHGGAERRCSSMWTDTRAATARLLRIDRAR